MTLEGTASTPQRARRCAGKTEAWDADFSDLADNCRINLLIRMWDSARDGATGSIGDSNPEGEEAGDFTHLLSGEASDRLADFLPGYGHQLVDLNLRRCSETVIGRRFDGVPEKRRLLQVGGQKGDGDTGVLGKEVRLDNQCRPGLPVVAGCGDEYEVAPLHSLPQSAISAKSSRSFASTGSFRMIID